MIPFIVMGIALIGLIIVRFMPDKSGTASTGGQPPESRLNNDLFSKERGGDEDLEAEPSGKTDQPARSVPPAQPAADLSLTRVKTYTKLAMNIVITIVVILSGLYVILSKDYDDSVQKWAFGAIGTVLGNWFGYKI